MSKFHKGQEVRTLQHGSWKTGEITEILGKRGDGPEYYEITFPATRYRGPLVELRVEDSIRAPRK
jgi:hypothetical protein